MTELGFELQNIEMKAGHDIPYTIRIRLISQDFNSYQSDVCSKP
jgi:hypothetical protein